MSHKSSPLLVLIQRLCLLYSCRLLRGPLVRAASAIADLRPSVPGGSGGHSWSRGCCRWRGLPHDRPRLLTPVHSRRRTVDVGWSAESGADRSCAGAEGSERTHLKVDVRLSSSSELELPASASSEGFARSISFVPPRFCMSAADRLLPDPLIPACNFLSAGLKAVACVACACERNFAPSPSL